MLTINKKNNSGFTLVEILITLVIFSFIIILLTTLILDGFRFYRQAYIASRVQDSARIAFETLIRDIITNKVGNGDTPNCINFNGWDLLLQNPDTNNVVSTYHLLNGILYRNGASILSSDVEITSMYLCISSRTQSGSPRPTKVTVLATFRTKSTTTPYQIDLQTTVTQRHIGPVRYFLREI